MSKKKVLVGLSGGVDSSVAASLLLEQGYEVHGVYVEAYNEPGCRTDQDKKNALQVALKLGIPFKVLDWRREYKQTVVDYFLNEYREGRTPNPDIICNRDIKFGLLYEHMEQHGFDYLATGHYCRVSRGSTKSEILNSKQNLNSTNTYDKYYLQQPVDLSKDQTYFLWQVSQEKLGKIRWPLGSVKKRWVRQRATELGLPNADKPDSMGVCMIGELNMGEFLRAKLGTNPGPVWWQGREVGRHEGLWFYTIGSRGGWELNLKSETRNPKVDLTNLPPLYVIKKDPKRNILEVGVREECMSKKLQITNFKLQISEEGKLWVRIRNLGELAAVTRLHGETVTLEQPVFALAPGQSAVFYDERGCVVGGGIIGDGR